VPKADPAKAPADPSAGYVAVVATQKSQADALRAFADLDTRYPGVLTGKTPEVQQADLTARGLGVMYRVIVGPPGSRDAAAKVCTQLKAAGYNDCWTKRY
jgi:hypothetical protein